MQIALYYYNQILCLNGITLFPCDICFNWKCEWWSIQSIAFSFVSVSVFVLCLVSTFFFHKAILVTNIKQAWPIRNQRSVLQTHRAISTKTKAYSRHAISNVWRLWILLHVQSTRQLHPADEPHYLWKLLRFLELYSNTIYLWSFLEWSELIDPCWVRWNSSVSHNPFVQHESHSEIDHLMNKQGITIINNNNK